MNSVVRNMCIDYMVRLYIVCLFVLGLSVASMEMKICTLPSLQNGLVRSKSVHMLRDNTKWIGRVGAQAFTSHTTTAEQHNFAELAGV